MVITPAVKDYTFFTFPEPFPKPSCGICGRSEKALRCSRCQVQFYCSAEHQKAHFLSHKTACGRVKRAREKIQHEEQKLRNAPPDMFLPPNVFEEQVGHFWGIMETRDYMRARCAYYEALMLIPTKEAIKAQLDNALDMLRLCRGDNCGVRSSVPSLMIQLDQDQEAYDFIKWWETDGNKSDYDWGDMDLPYLNVKGADVFEPVDWLNRRFGDLGYTTAVVLLKIKLQRDLLALKDPATLLGRVPQEIVDNIARNNVRSPIIANDKQILSASDHTALIKTLDDQIAALIRMIEKQNPFFWKILLTASPPFPPLPYSHGSKEEAQNVLRDSYGAWKDAVGAMDLVRTKLGK